MKRIYYWFLTKLLKNKLFYTADIAEVGKDYSCFVLWEIDRDGIFKIKKIKHSSN